MPTNGASAFAIDASTPSTRPYFPIQTTKAIRPMAWKTQTLNDERDAICMLRSIAENPGATSGVLIDTTGDGDVGICAQDRGCRIELWFSTNGDFIFAAKHVIV